MSTSSNDASWGKRKSMFALSALNAINFTDDGRPSKTSKKQKHNRTPSLFTDLNHPDAAHEVDGPNSPKLRRPSLSLRGSAMRAPSMVTSLRTSARSSSDDVAAYMVGEPLSATSSRGPFPRFGDESMGLVPALTVLLHGEVQTSAGMFRKKKEYLVLTETHIIRYKSQARAAEAFKLIPQSVGKIAGVKHGAVPSVGSQSDLQTLSDTSGDKDGRVLLRQVVAVYRLDDGKPYFAIEVSYLDEESGQASALTLQFGNPEERDVWLKNIRGAANDTRLLQRTYISTFNIENAARVVERDHDYDPANCAIFKIVQQHTTSKSGRSSSDDLTKVASTVCFLAIGVHKVHIIQLVKAQARASSPSFASNNAQTSFGVLTLTGIKVSDSDDSFELTFRQPLQKSRQLLLASSASHEIALRLHSAENFLRPEAGHRLFKFSAPPEVERHLSPPVSSNEEEHSCLDRTLAAYCIAYGLNPTNVRYTINYECEDAPRFELLPPADKRRPEYGPIALMAIMRALRYNESFGSLCFAGIPLDSLNGLHDNYGTEHICSRTKRGTPIRLSAQELGRSSLLVQEVRALAATSKKLRRLDFSGCITANASLPSTVEVVEDENSKLREIGCGIVEALSPLCRHQTTNVDWICLNGIDLSDTDLDYLVGAAVDKSCHFRAIELNRCGLSDRSMGLILDALRAQDNTLEAIEIAGNTARLNHTAFDSQLSIFGFIRKLNLSYASRTSGSEPLLSAETLLIWRLQELRFSGTALNGATIDAVATYLAHPQSKTLHELYFDNAYLSGSDVATLLYSLTQDPAHPRELHFDISQSYLSKGLELVTEAIANGLTPTHLSMRAIEYREESQFRKMLAALTENKSIRYLDISQAALPGDASDDTCRALCKFLAENDTLLELNLSGEDSRLATSKFGAGINDALAGLKQNKSIRSFWIEKQRLGLQGASTLADVLKDNKTLRELHCGYNEIPLHGLTDLVNSLVENTTLVYLPSMEDGREAAFKSAEMTMKNMYDTESPVSPTSKPAPFGSSSGMKRGLASVRRSAARTASAYTPSFSALPSYGRSLSSPNSQGPPPLTLTLPPPRNRQSSQSMVTSPTSFTVQDIQTTHRLLTEQWDRQCYRLSQYLQRNWSLLNENPVNTEIRDEKFEPVEPVGSIGKILEQVKHDTTPRAEKERFFDSLQDPTTPPDELNKATVTNNSVHKTKPQVSFKDFLLEYGPESPVDEDDEDELANRTKQLRINTELDLLEEPRTPTQNFFTP